MEHASKPNDDPKNQSKTRLGIILAIIPVAGAIIIAIINKVDFGGESAKQTIDVNINTPVLEPQAKEPISETKTIENDESTDIKSFEQLFCETIEKIRRSDPEFESLKSNLKVDEQWQTIWYANINLEGIETLVNYEKFLKYSYLSMEICEGVDESKAYEAYQRYAELLKDCLDVQTEVKENTNYKEIIYIGTPVSLYFSYARKAGHCRISITVGDELPSIKIIRKGE